MAITFLIVDFPRADICDPSDWECMIQVAQFRTNQAADLIIPNDAEAAETLSEANAKQALPIDGVTIPSLRTGDIDSLSTYADSNMGTNVLKSIGIAHKSETGGVALSLANGDDVRSAGARMTSETFILEEMVTGATAEILIGVVKDPAHGFIMTLGAGGIFKELLKESVSVLLPTTRSNLKQSLKRLKAAKIIDGYRNQPAGNIDAVLDACEAIHAYVLANLNTIEEVEVNPLIVTQTRAVAVDTLIRKPHD